VSQTQLPVAAIGGITIARLDEIRRSGVAMAAVLSAVTAAQPRTAAERLVSRWSAAG
jgi:thiamine monophosphate synthase